MIKAGQRFTHKDLTQSISELRGTSIQKYLQKSRYGVAIGNTLIIPAECTPDEYATACINEYNDVPSSAINLDNQLRDKGFKTTHRFAYKYRTPGLSSHQIIHDAYFLDWFHQIYNTAMPHSKHQAEYFDLINNAFRTSYYYAQYLWAQNRPVCNAIAGQMQIPGAEQWEQITGAILGVGFQFHPYDVYEYSIEHINPTLSKAQHDARYAQQLEFKNQINNDYGIDTGCLVLSPNSRKKLQKIVTRTDTPYWLQVIKNLATIRNR